MISGTASASEAFSASVPLGSWKVIVEVVPIFEHPTELKMLPVAVSFDLHVMAEDAGIKTDMSIVPADYKPGNQLKLQPKLKQFHRPIAGLGSKPGDRM